MRKYPVLRRPVMGLNDNRERGRTSRWQILMQIEYAQCSFPRKELILYGKKKKKKEKRDRRITGLKLVENYGGADDRT